MSSIRLKKRFALPLLAAAVVTALVLSPAFAAAQSSQIKEESKPASTQAQSPKASAETPAPASQARAASPSASGEPTRWLYEGVGVSGLSGNPLDHLTGADNLAATPQLWVNVQVTLEAVDQAAAPFTFLSAGLDDPAPAAADFNSAPASVSFVLPHPATDSTDYPLAVYARADADCVFNENTPEEVNLTQGQVLRLPAVYLDTTPPEQNGAAQVDGGRFFDGVLYATDIELTIPAHDVAPVGVTGADAANVMSGLAKAVLSYNGTELDTVQLNAEGTPKNEEDFVFSLSAPASYDVDKLNVELFDRAGNSVSAPLADVEDASGNALTGGKIVLTDTEPTVSVAYEAHETITSDFYGERTAVVSVRDAHLDALLGWYATLSAADKQAVAPVITLENTLLGASDPARLMSISLDQLTQPTLDLSYGEARVPVATSGRYRVIGAEGVPSYASIVPGVGSTWASDANLAPFVVDADAPTAGAVTIDPTQMLFYGSLYSMSDVTVTFELEDKESGIDPNSVVLTMDGTSQRLEFKADDDNRSGSAQWNVTAPQVDLSKVALTFKDKTGHESSIPNLKEYSQKNIDISFIYAFVAKPTLSLAFDNNDVRNGKYFNEARTATVTLEDPTFAAVKQHNPDLALVTRTHNGLDETFPASSFENSSGNGTTWTTEITCSADGTYRVSAEYTNPAGISADAVSSGEFVVDQTPPVAGAVAFAPEAVQRWGWLFVQDGAQASFALSDATSGLDASTIELAEPQGTQVLPSTLGDDGLQGEALWSLEAQDRALNLADVSLSFADKAGNSAKVSDLAAYHNKNMDIQGVFMDRTAPVIQVAFDNNDVRNGKYFNAHRRATVTLIEASFGFVHDNDPDRTVAVSYRDGQEMPIPASSFENPSGDNLTWVATIPCDMDGVYRIEADFTDPSSWAAEPYRGEEFVVDTTAPTAGAVTVSPVISQQWGWLFAQGDVQVAFALDDVTSGIDPTTVSLVEPGGTQALPCTADGSGASGYGSSAVWSIPAQDRAIPLSAVSFSFADLAGNLATVNDVAAHGQRNIEAAGVFADGTAPVIDVVFDNNDVRNGKYYNAHRTATVTLSEASFKFVRDNDPDRTVAVRHHDGQKMSVPASSFTNPSGDGSTWIATVPCDVDGVYRIEVDFTDPSGRTAEPYHGEEFVVDTVAPTAGAVTVSPVKTQQWGWLFTQGDAQAVFELDDVTSGIDPATVSLTEPAGTQSLPCTADSSGQFGHGSKAVWDIPAQDRAISLSSVSFSFADLAGNPATVGDVAAHGQRNLEEVGGVFADDTAPVIDVTFDNNDVRNGKYYNAHRTATFTLTEASFSFVRDNDPRRVVVTQQIDQAQRSVRAEDFENPSGDNLTWVATVPCDSDGVYRLDVDFTDPSGRMAEPYRGEEFVVDTTAPLIILTFDNNNAESGMYFKAPRTATAVVYDDNFSADLAGVTVSAADAAGAAVAAPGNSMWSELPPGTWTSTVYFGQELHYTMGVTCTDLAGNVAEPANEPEFVVDMTAPQVSIERIADHAAYKDQVTPLVTFQDQNFEPFLTEVAVTGSRRGDQLYFNTTDVAAETSRTVDFADFDYDVAADDVYTLTAKMKDKAGNVAEQAVTFSVNRFGSNYELSASTGSLLGSYIKQGQEIVLTETNVSGLERSSARVAHNDQVRDLQADRDYTVEHNDDEDSWSRYTYTFPAKLFKQDGYYRVLVSSVDQAGGLSENLMPGKNGDRTGAMEIAFAVDSTSPTATIGGVESRASYYAPSQRVDVYTNDNMQADTAVAMIDGKAVAEWDAETLRDARMLSFDLPAADRAQTVRVEVRDKAGNTTQISTADVMVTGDLGRYVVSTPSILYPLVAGGVVVAAAALVLLARVLGARSARAAGITTPLIQGAVKRR